MVSVNYLLFCYVKNSIYHWFIIHMGTVHQHRESWLQEQKASGYLSSRVRVWMLAINSVSLFYIQLRKPFHGMLMPTFRGSLPTTVNLVWILPHRDDQLSVSIEILHPIKLKIKIIHTRVHFHWKFHDTYF